MSSDPEYVPADDVTLITPGPLAVAALRSMTRNDVAYDALAFVCPGCVAMGAGSGLHMLPVNTTAVSPSWEWNGDLTRPTVSPSILTRYTAGTVCHSFMRDGRVEFLTDCTHELAGQTVDLPALPEWIQ